MNEPIVPDRTALMLHGIVGSHAFGLAREDSDVDTIAMYAEPADFFLGLEIRGEPDMSKVITRPDGDDSQAHEVSKFLRLALKCNPTCTDALWLPEHLALSPAAADLVANRRRLLSAPTVRAAYRGIAESQASLVRRLQREKPARHLARLVVQARSLWITGELTVRTPDPEACWDFGRRAAQDPSLVAEQLRQLVEALDRPTPLPELPDREWAQNWLLDVRREQFTASMGHTPRIWSA